MTKISQLNKFAKTFKQTNPKLCRASRPANKFLSGLLPVKQEIYTNDKKFLHSEDSSQKLQSTRCGHFHSAPSANTRWPNSPRADSC